MTAARMGGEGCCSLCRIVHVSDAVGRLCGRRLRSGKRPRRRVLRAADSRRARPARERARLAAATYCAQRRSESDVRVDAIAS